MKKLSKQSIITLVELPATQFGKLDSPVAYDFYSLFKLPPRALPTLASILKQDGFENVEMISPVFHGKNWRLSKKNYSRMHSSDFLGISTIARTALQSMELAKDYKLHKPDGICGVGGMDASYRIKDYLERKAVDIVFIGEAEKTIIESMHRLVSGSDDLSGINGLAHKRNGEIIINPPREIMSEEEFCQLPMPYFDAQMIKKARTAVIEQERGCPFGCNFCLVTKTYGSIIRHSSNEKTVSELKRIKENKMGHTIFFTGDNMAGSPKKSLELMGAIEQAGLYYPHKIAQVSVSLAKQPELMSAMKKVNLDRLCVGFESINDSSLKDMNKPFSSKQNTEAAKTFREYGFWIHAMMIAGADSDTKDSIKEITAWAKENVDSLQLFMLTPFAGTAYYEKMENEGRILTKDWYLYDCQHCVIRPANMSPYELQSAVTEAYNDFYSIRSTLKRFKKSPNKKLTAAFTAYVLSGGIKKIIASPQAIHHLDFLKSIS